MQKQRYMSEHALRQDPKTTRDVLAAATQLTEGKRSDRFLKVSAVNSEGTDMAYTTKQMRVLAAAEAAVRKSTDPARRKCFLSYHVADADEVTAFIDSFGDVFIPKVLGVSDESPFIDSDDTDYIMDKIREDHLTDSTVTIVLVGKCTWARRFVDWEVYSTLRNDKNNRRSGLLAIELKSVKGDSTLPARVSDNVKRDANKKDVGYARWIAYPISKETLRSYIEDAFNARTSRPSTIVNTRERKKANSTCA